MSVVRIHAAPTLPIVDHMHCTDIFWSLYTLTKVDIRIQIICSFNPWAAIVIAFLHIIECVVMMKSMTLITISTHCGDAVNPT